MSSCKPEGLCLTLSEQSSGTTVTQVQAIEFIYYLLQHDCRLIMHDELINAGLYVLLENLQHSIMSQNRCSARYNPDLLILLASSRKALIFVEENEVNTVAKPLLRLDILAFLRRELYYSPALTQAFRNAMSVLYSTYQGESSKAFPDARSGALSHLALVYISSITAIHSVIFKYLSVTWSALHLRQEHTPYRRCPMPPLTRIEIEQFIHAVTLVQGYFFRRSICRIHVRSRIFKTVGEEGHLRYYSVVQVRGDYRGSHIYGNYTSLDALYFPDDLQIGRAHV